MDIKRAIEFVVEDQRDNTDPIESSSMTDRDLILYVRNILDEGMLIEYGEGDQSFDAYRAVVTATPAQIEAILPRTV